MPPDNPLHRGQSDARSFEILLPMQPLEHSEELIGILRVEPTPLSRTKIVGWPSVIREPTSITHLPGSA